MRTNKRKTRSLDENRLLPEDLTNQLRQLLQDLPPSRKRDYLNSVVFSKFVSKDTDPGVVRRQRAINKWLATERNNEATNDRLATISEEYNILPRVTYGSFMSKVASIVEQVIGEVPPNEALDGAFSGGATTSRKRTESHPTSKYLGMADATRDALPLVEQVLLDRPLWEYFRCETDSVVRIVPGNVLFTVSKTTEIDRCACKEPDLNMYIQKGIGRVIRKRLRGIGINLNDQSRNRNLARLGSLNGSLATLDLSSASDSVSTELVQQCLPPLWFSLLNQVRSHVTLIDGEIHRNEMFSSMGNGFTFELESLLFYAIARATAYFRGVSGVISVYGDDIICPTDIAEDTIFVLSILGFETNVKKSFWTGDFRESCGGHYVGGRDITPFYVRKPVLRLVDLIHLANSIRKWACVEGLQILDPEVDDLWWHFASMVPRQFWGGHDCADKSRLVSYWRPNKPMKLVPIRKEIPTDIGGYLFWHDSVDTDTDEREASATSLRLEERSKYRVKPVRKYQNGKPDAIFLAELESGARVVT